MSNRKTCASVPCPPWQDDVRMEITGVCDCSPWEAWRTPWGDLSGNPWGKPDCPVHGDRVQEMLADRAAVVERLQAARPDDWEDVLSSCAQQGVQLTMREPT